MYKRVVRSAFTTVIEENELFVRKNDSKKRFVYLSKMKYNKQSLLFNDKSETLFLVDK
jgi:hypothetical protein